MKINLHSITIRDLVKGYVNNKEHGVFGYDGKLNIRPAYQREFFYKEATQQAAVIKTVLGNFPLNTMYWSKNSDGTFELLDGQQRTISICRFINGEFSIKNNRGNTQYFNTLSDAEKNLFLDYSRFTIFICEGTEEEKLDWFKVINTATAQLTEQELLNAVYTGPWLSDAKEYFSQTNCQARNIAQKYLDGVPIRQDYLETVISWANSATPVKNDNYMSKHQHDPDAKELWSYFVNVIDWVKKTFPEYRSEMKGLPWGLMYNDFKDKKLDPATLEEEVSKLMQDEDVTKKSGIYPFVLTREEKYLNVRVFSDKQKREAYERQKGICVKCGKHFDISEMDGDHILPWSKGGKTTSDNCQMLCKRCNKTSSNK